MVKRTRQTVKKHLQVAGYGRWFRAFVALVLLVSLAIPAFNWLDNMKAYAISPEVERVIGPANKNLSAKFSFDQSSNMWQFNKNGAAALASNIAKQQGSKDTDGVADALSQLMAKQIGGSGKKDTSLYSVDLPVKARDGITYYDNVTRLSFKMVPSFSARDGKLVQDRIVYPFMDGAQIVYTAKTNGLKEDIVLSKFIGETVRYSYELELPNTLQAKLLEDGSVGIYSGNPALFGNISFNSDEDRARVMEARKTSSKDNLVFAIPAPFIKDQAGNAGHTRYYLNGDRLTVVADGLKDLKYPLTVDPSVTVTSSTDFENGNNEGEGSINVGNDAVRRGDVTGGTVGTWANADISPGSPFSTARSSHNTVTYNGYIYVIGGAVSGGATTDVRYAAICNGSNTNGGCTAGAGNAGKVGTWTSGGTLTEGRASNGVAVYNGFIYVVGGTSGGANQSNNVQYSQIGANGVPGTWTNLGTFPTDIMYSDLIAYNGYLYIAGGCTNLSAALCSTFNGNVYSAAINGNGTLGSWTQLSGTPLGAARYGHTTFAYNGYMYVLGGCTAKDVLNNCTTTTTSTEYAKINADGTLGSWAANTALSTARRELKSTVSNGYVYITGDNAISSYVSYAPIYASGIIGTWASTNTSATSKKDVALANYNGYLYMTGGCTSNVSGCNSGGAYINVSEYAKIDLAGAIESYAAETDTIETDGLMHSTTVAYNGFLYMLGGANGTGMNNTVTTVYKAALNSDGSTGAWSTTSSFNAQRAGAAAVAYNGYMYILGGHHTTVNTSCSPTNDLYCTDVQKAVINSDGTLGAWSSAGGDFSTQGRGYLGAAVYNGYIYAFGGIYNNNTNVSAETTVGQIQSDGNVTGWTTTGNLATGVGDVSVAQYGPYLFALAGRTAGVNFANVVQYAVLNNSGTITWQSTTAFTGGRANFMAGAYNGYVYIAGGIQGTGINNTNDTQYARICQTTATIDGCNGTVGTLGTWHTTKSFTTARGGHMGTIYNGYLYAMGGCSNWGLFGACSSSAALLNDLQYTKINNSGNGSTGSWTTTTNIGQARHEFGSGSFAYNGYLYVMGGYLGISTGSDGQADEIRYAPIQANGTIGSWTNMPAASTPNSLPNSGWLQHNGYVYQVGGKLSATFYDKVEYAAICTGSNTTVQFGANASITDTGDCTTGSTPGIFSAWKTTGSLGTARGMFGVATYNGYMYAFAGCTGTNGDFFNACQVMTSTVEVAQIDSTTGAPGTWSTLGGSYNVPTARHSHSVVGYGGYVYVIGGCTNASSPAVCNQNLNDVRVAKLNGATLAADAGCGAIWCQQDSFAVGRYALSAQAYNGYLYIFGGYSPGDTGVHDDVQYAPITQGGIGKWTRNPNNFTTARNHHATTIYNGYAYVMGGKNNGGSFYADVQVTGLQSIARIGRYSRLLTVPLTTEIAGVYYNGTMGSRSTVEYKVAPSSGVFGAATPATQGTGSEPTPACGLGSIYYVQVTVALDDTNRAVFGDTDQGNISDIVAYYRLNATPPPNLRLNGGKWFYNEAQQPLDICRE